MNYDQWNKLVAEGDDEIWLHLNSMMAGREGAFSQSLRFTLDAADSINSRRLYDAFPEYFTPKQK